MGILFVPEELITHKNYKIEFLLINFIDRTLQMRLKNTRVVKSCVFDLFIFEFIDLSG